MRSQVIWTRPKRCPAEQAKACARRALEAHRANRGDAAAFWLDRAHALALEAAQRPL